MKEVEGKRESPSFGHDEVSVSDHMSGWVVDGISWICGMTGLQWNIIKNDERSRILFSIGDYKPLKCKWVISIQASGVIHI
jgi:hypothetical protein